MSKTIMIHQPDFFPWLGFFDKFKLVDEFILLDHSIVHPKNRTWLRRVNIIVNYEEQFISLPLRKLKDSFVPIKDLEINKAHKQFKNILLTINLNYKRAPYFTEVFKYVKAYFDSESNYLQDCNLQFIQNISRKLNIDVPKITKSSALDVNNTSTNMILEICAKVNADTFLLTAGANEYSDKKIFEKNNINIKLHNFKHPNYIHFNKKEFIPGLSIIDPLMNLGFKNLRQILLKENWRK